ncbi:MAG TPA: hypothetical protein VKA90_01710 [Beijerinckiaceae bacterium]|jgi:hypothetical protein|nr:hypothetical protein [Beijerinckiaceae bacterium]
MPRQNDRQDQGNERQGQGLQRRYAVRQVTNIQASWTEQERGEEGKFTLQLVLDNGVEEYILDVDSDDMEPLLKLFGQSGYTTFDLDRKVLMFSNLTVK